MRPTRKNKKLPSLGDNMNCHDFYENGDAFVASTYTSAQLGLINDPGSEKVPFAGLFEDDEAYIFYQSRDHEASIAASLEDELGEYSQDEVHFVQSEGKVREIFDYIFDEELEMGITGSIELENSSLPRGPEALR